MPKTVFTDVAVRNLKPPESGQQTHWDTSPGFNGFGMRISQGGSKTWILMAGPPQKRRRYLLGRYPATSLSDARTAARKMHAQLTVGTRSTASIAFKDAVQIYLTTYCLKLRPKHRQETERILRRHFLPPLGARHLDQITTGHITAVLDPLTSSAPYMANNAYAAIRALMRWCVRRSYIKNSPCESLQRPAAHISRDRVLADQELAAVYKAAQHMAFPFGFIVLLLIHLPLRRNEAALLKWSYITNDVITLPAEIMKNKRELVLPNLLAHDLTIIPRSADYLFPSSVGTPFSAWSKNKRRLDKLSGVQNWTLHDLRRTVASKMAEWQCGEPHVIDRILGHVTGSMSKMARVYNRHTYLAEARSCLQLYEQRLAAIISSH